MSTIRPFRLVLAPLVLLALACGQASAAPPPVAPHSPPDTLARESSVYLQGEIQKHAAEFSKDPQKLYQFVNESILPLFDFDYTSQLVLGKNWRDANADQRARFTEAFKSMLVRTYAHALLEYRDQKIEWQPLKTPAGANDVSVESSVIRSNGPPIPMSYRMHQKDGEWKVYDVVIDAVSLVTNYRGSFAAEVRKNGLDSLIARLENKQSTALSNAPQQQSN
jgi:phospholipid transport system substrate-binding protein